MLFVQSRRKEKIQAIEDMLSYKDKKNTMFRIRDSKVVLVLCSIFAAICGVVLGVFTENSSVILGVMGSIIPYLILTIRRKLFMKAYWQDAKQAIQFAAAIFAAGGSLEDWLYEVLPRLSGPLKREFQTGITNHKRGISITHFLETLAQRSPHMYFQYVVVGLLANYRNSGDQKEFLSEVMNDMSNNERFARIMESERKRNQNMLLFVIGFPVSMYLLFQDSVNYTLKNHPSTNLVLLVGVLGLIGILWLANRLTKTSLN